MSKSVPEGKAILQNMLQYHSQWNSERAPKPSSRKINSIKELDSLSNKVDSILAYKSKQNLIMFLYNNLLKIILKM